ncbi:hypothetical protein V7S43_003110 [Phytophthora oleae]|uniref:PH domain-containing protein n=1 Tax=Phytophthora oleae TaxID=2107226 RepID=A0ABD3G0E9_9STRA
MKRMGDLTLQPTPPIPPEIEGFLKKLKRKTRSLAGNWNKRWFFVDPRRREFGYSDNRSSAPRSSIYLDDITAVVQFDDTHFQVESRTRNFFLCGDSKASTACWVTSLEGYRKKLIEYEKDKIAYAAYAASAASKASAPATDLCLENPQQSPPPAAERQVANRTKKSRDCSEDEPSHSSSSSSMSSTSSSSRSKRDKAADRLPPKSEQRSASPLAIDNRRSGRSKNDRHRDRERGRDRDHKFEREHKREPSNDRDGNSERERLGHNDRDRNSERDRSGHSDRDRSRDRNARAPSGRGSVMQAWVDDF